MQARMKNPALVIPEAMQALQALSKSVQKSGFPRKRWNWFTCEPARSMDAACAWTCTRGC
jgi:hypothetical protein